MKQGFIFLVFILFFAQGGFSQSYDKDYFEKSFYNAENLLEKGNFQEAVLIYKYLLKMDAGNSNLNFKIGFCYLNTELEKSQSIPYLKNALKGVNIDAQSDDPQEKASPIETYLYLAQAYHLNKQFKKAIEIIDTLKITVPNYKTEFITNIDGLVENCKDGIELMKHPVKMVSKNLGEVINTEFDEHSPVVSADESTLIFTSKRKGNSDKTTDDGQYFEDIYISQRKKDSTWTIPVLISENINTAGHEASIGLSVDGQELYIYKDESNAVNEKNGNIYYSKLSGDVWSKPILPGPNINTKYNENHASISADGTELYFTSDRPGGFGGMDIYMSKRLPPDGFWGEARNLGKTINTAEDEICPFIHPDGVTLFFSSKSHMNMGGFDIFFSSKDEDGNWAEPTNVGYPINTTSDDVFYTPTPDGLRAYYTSQQMIGFGRSDIYLITFPESEEKSLAVMTGIITMADGTSPSDVSITVADASTKEIVGTYSPNSKTGKYLFILKSGKNYTVTMEAGNSLPVIDNLSVLKGTSYQQIEKAIKLDPIILGKISTDYSFHFAESSTELDNKEANSLISIAKVLQFASKYQAEIILPKNSDNKDLDNIRAEILSENLVDHKVAENKIKILSTPSSINESIRLFIVVDKEEDNN